MEYVNSSRKSSVIWIGTALFHWGRLFPSVQGIITSLKWEWQSMKQKTACNTKCISKLRNSRFWHVMLESLRKITHLTKASTLLYCWYVSKGACPAPPLSLQRHYKCTSFSLVITLRIIKGSIHLNVVINVPHGIAALTALYFVISQTLCRWLYQTNYIAAVFHPFYHK